MADETRTTTPEDPSASTTPEDPLAWEARNARRAGFGALAAGVLTVMGGIVRALAQSGIPNADERALTIVDTLSRTAAGQPIPPGRVSAIAEYIGTHTAPFVLGGLLLGLGGLLMFAPLGYLFRATRARVPINRIGLYAAAVGAAAFGIGQAVTLIATALGASSFADGADKSNAEAAEALSNSTASAAQLIRDLGGLALALAFVLIALAAMRAGLLTRFMGILGAIVGASLVLPLDQLGIIRSFWLGALGVLILGLRPERRPPAWAVAEAVPWPTQQQIREQREAARRARAGDDRARAGDDRARAGDDRARTSDDRAGGDADRAQARKRAERVPRPQAPQPRRTEPTGARPHSSSKKRKRKRR